MASTTGAPTVFARATLALLVALLVTGCSVRGAVREDAGPAQAAAHTTHEPSEAAALGLVRYANGLRTLPPAALDAERQRAEHELATTRSADAALRMSLLLTSPQASAPDPARAEALLHAVGTGVAADPAQTELARFLLALLVEQPRHAEELRVAAAPGDTALAREVDELRRALAAERSRRDELEQQVQALKQLEQSLNQRPNALD
jgi:hypothetical protein